MKRYYYINVGIRTGEYTFNSKSVHFDESTTPLVDVGYEYCRDFYGRESDEERRGFFFNGCEVYVWCDEIKLITEEEYNVLNNFM